MKNIRQIFKDSKIVCSITALDSYLCFIEKHNQHQNKKGETSLHHILPQAKNLPFTKYKNLKENPWNGVYLSYKDHYIAHYLLCSVSHQYSIISAFCAMNNLDLKNKRLTEDDLIGAEEYQRLIKLRTKKMLIWLDTVREDGLTNKQYQIQNRTLSKETLKKLSERMSGKNNIVYKPGVVAKIINTKNNRIINGKNMHVISAERAAKTMIKNGTYKQSAIKHSHTLNELTLYNGKYITKAQKYGIDRSIVRTPQGRMYSIKSIYDDSIYFEVYANTARQVTPGYESVSKDKYLGKHTISHKSFVNREYLIGLYFEEIFQINNPVSYDHVMDNIQAHFKIPIYVVKNVFDTSFRKNLYMWECAKISQKLLYKTKKNYLYKHYKKQNTNRGLYVYKVIS